MIDAVYENGVLKPLGSSGLKEHQRYRVVAQEVAPEPDELELDPESAAEIKSRTTVLPDGRELINLENIMAHHFPAWIDVGELLAEAMEEVRRERQAHFEAELDEFFPLDEGGQGTATR
ncbi:MAG: antitoxin family protein [Blastocatellia bacterium]